MVTTSTTLRRSAIVLIMMKCLSFTRPFQLLQRKVRPSLSFSGSEVVVPSNNIKSIIVQVSFDGSRFTGWSAANDPKIGGDKKKGFVRSVQGILHTNVSKLYGKLQNSIVVEVDGCSRTDKGVHARCLVAQIYAWYKDGDYVSFIEGKRHPHPRHSRDPGFVDLPMSMQRIAYCLNRMMPPDVRVMAISESPPEFHPTLSSRSKTYRYHVEMTPRQWPHPTKARYSWQRHCARSVPDILQELERVSRVFLGTHNFNAFCGSQKNASQNPECTILSINAFEDDGAVSIDITGDRFLYKMVRFMVGALVTSALSENLSIQDLEKMLAAGKRDPNSFPCAPARGLVLQSIACKDDVTWLAAES